MYIGTYLTYCYVILICQVFNKQPQMRAADDPNYQTLAGLDNEQVDKTQIIVGHLQLRKPMFV